MRFNLVVRDQQRRGQAVIEANDAARRQTATPRDARSVAAARTKLQGNAADKHDGSQSAKAAGVKTERNRRYENNECFVCGEQGHKQWGCPRSQQSKVGKGVHGPSHGQARKQQQHQQQSTSGPAQRTRSKATGAAPTSATPTAGASGCKTASKAVVTGTEPAAPAASTKKVYDYVYIRVPREEVVPVDTERTETVQHHVSQSAGPQKAAPVVQSAPVQLPAPASQQWFVRACLGLAAWRVWRYERRYGGHRTASRGAEAAFRGASCGSRCVRGC